MPMRSLFRPRWVPILLSLGILGSGCSFLSQKVPSLVTLDAQSGKVLWSTSGSSVAPIRKIITYKGRVYTLAASRKESCGHWCVFPQRDVPGITQVTAFDTVSGKQLWQFKTDSNHLDWADIEVTEQSVLLKTDKITAIDLISGQTQWSVALSVNVESPYEGAPSFNPNLVVSRDRVALLRVEETPEGETSGATVETWQKATGKQHQSFTPTPSSENLHGASLAATDDTILLFVPEARTNKVLGYAPETGKLKFSITTVINQGGSINDFYRYLQFSGSTIYQYIYNGLNQGKSVVSVEAYDANTGKLRWQVPISDSRCANFGSVPDGFYLGCNSSSSGSAYLMFLDEKTGQQRWMKRFPSDTVYVQANTRQHSYISFAGYYMTSDEIVASVKTRDDAERQSFRLVAFSKTDGRELWSVNSFETSLYGADGGLVFLDTKAIRLSNL